MTARDISVDGETAFYSYRGKGGKHGRRELSRPAYEALVATLSDAGLDLASMDPGASLWQAGGHPRGVTGGTVYTRFRAYLRAAGLPQSGLHLLRHSAAKLRRDAGESIEAVSAFLDHSSWRSRRSTFAGLRARPTQAGSTSRARSASSRTHGSVLGGRRTPNPVRSQRGQ